MINKRQQERVEISFPLECQALPSLSYFYTVSKDLSLGGVRIISKDFLAKDDPLKLQINLVNKTLNLRAEVVWCNKERTSDRYATGLRFTNLNPTIKNELTSLLNTINN